MTFGTMKMIAIWGSSGAGKSTLALAVASALAEKGKNAVIVSLDMKTPSLPVFLPRATALTINNSLGSLLASDNISYDSLRSKIHIHPQSQHIGFAGLVSGENPISTPLFQREKIIDFLRVLDGSPFDYIIFDCDSNTFYDQLSLYALEISDHVLQVITPDVKGIEFEKAAFMWMKNSENFSPGKHIKIINMAHDSSPIVEVKAISENVSHALPFSLEIHNRFSSGELISRCTDKKSQRFEKIVKKIVKEKMLNE